MVHILLLIITKYGPYTTANNNKIFIFTKQVRGHVILIEIQNLSWKLYKVNKFSSETNKIIKSVYLASQIGQTEKFRKKHALS